MSHRVLPISLAGVLALTVACDEPGPPVPCEGAVLPDVQLHVGESSRVVVCFSSDALPLVYATTTSDPGIVGVEVAGRTVEMTATGQGQAVVSVTATDANGKNARQIMRVVVPNRAPVQVAELPLLGIPLWNVVALDLNDYIADPDSDALTFQLRTRGEQAVKAEVRGDSLVVHAVKLAATTHLDIKATDPLGESLSLDVTTTVGPAIAYLTQGSHARHSDVPLVAGKQALMRLFLVTDSFGVAVPGVAASILDRAGNLLRSFKLRTGGMTSLPQEIDESRLDRSFAERIGPEYLVPGARLVVDIERTKDPAVTRRIEKPLNVVQMPVLDLTLVPVVMGDNDAAVQTVAEIERDPLNHPLLAHMRTLLPVDTVVLRSHLPFHVSDDFFEQLELIGSLAAIWEMEGRRGVYLGIIPEPIGFGLLGQAFGPRGPRVAYSVRRSSIIGHEMGHVFGLLHAPCGTTAHVDDSYPYPHGQIGVWGYNFTSEDLVRPQTSDMMGYCRPVWLSDYNYRLAIQTRLDEPQRSPPAQGERQHVLAVQGSIDANGNAILQRAFYINGAPTRISGESHRVAGSGPGGELFSYSFAPDEIMDGPGGASFFHLIPVRWREEELSTITFTAPGGRMARLNVDTGVGDPVVERDGQVVRFRGHRR